jgi:hypothetical protein
MTLENEDTTLPHNIGFQLHSDAAPYPTGNGILSYTTAKTSTPKICTL